MSFQPYPFQSEVVDTIDRLQGRALLAASMGLGKSAMSLMWAVRHQSWPTIIVCPASIKYNWEVECRRHFGLRAAVLEGRKVIGESIPVNRKILIVNYDILDAWVGYLRSRNPQLIIVDECQAIKTPKTKRTKATRALCHEIPHVIALSGTPLVNRPIELWPVLNILRSAQFPSYSAFGHAWCAPRLTPWGVWSFDGCHKPKELHHLLTTGNLQHPPIMVRRRKEEVLDQLPPKLRVVLPLPIEREKEYREAFNDFLNWLAKVNPNHVRKARNAKSLVRIAYVKRLAAELKLDSALSWVDNFLEGGDDKIILFAVHKDVIQKTAERYKRQCVVVDGSVTGAQRQACFDQFNKDLRCRVFVGNIKAAGVGWSAKSCSTVAFLEYSWTPGDHLQAEDRVHGIGRGIVGQQSSSYWLVGRGTFEETLCGILQRKADTLDKVLDGGQVLERLDVLEQLLEALQPKAKVR